MVSDTGGLEAEFAGAQHRAYMRLGDLLRCAAQHHLPALEWVINPAGNVITGRCHASRDRAQRHADFEAWVKALNLRASADAADGTTRLTARPRHCGEYVQVELTAKLPTR